MSGDVVKAHRGERWRERERFAGRLTQIISTLWKCIFSYENKQGIGARSVEANTFEIKLRAKRWIKNGICFRER